MMSLAYMNRVLDILLDSPDLRKTVSGIARQTSYAAGGAAAGGIIGGPAGALLGAVVGAVLGYTSADPYDSLIDAVRKLSDRDKMILGTKVQELVGAVAIDEFVEWIKTEAHRRLLFTLLRQSVSSTC